MNEKSIEKTGGESPPTQSRGMWKIASPVLVPVEHRGVYYRAIVHTRGIEIQSDSLVTTFGEIGWAELLDQVLSHVDSPLLTAKNQVIAEMETIPSIDPITVRVRGVSPEVRAEFGVPDPPDPVSDEQYGGAKSCQNS